MTQLLRESGVNYTCISVIAFECVKYFYIMIQYIGTTHPCFVGIHTKSFSLLFQNSLCGRRRLIFLASFYRAYKRNTQKERWRLLSFSPPVSECLYWANGRPQKPYPLRLQSNTGNFIKKRTKLSRKFFNVCDVFRTFYGTQGLVFMTELQRTYSYPRYLAVLRGRLEALKYDIIKLNTV